MGKWNYTPGEKIEIKPLPAPVPAAQPLPKPVPLMPSQPVKDEKPLEINIKPPKIHIPKPPEAEHFTDWFILGFTFTVALVILFLFSGAMDVNIAYSIKYFFQYIVVALTVSLLIAGIIEWTIFKKKKVGYFSVGMVVCIALVLLIVAISAFVPALTPLSNAILANDGPYTAQSAQAILSQSKAFYAEQANKGDPGSALRAIYAESADIGGMDVDFYQNRLQNASFGPSSGEALFALITAFNASPKSLAVAVSKFGSINTLTTKNQLSASLTSDPTYVGLMNDESVKSIAVDESKLGETNPELEGKYPDTFWIESRKQVVNYLAQFLAYKKQSLQSSLDSNNYIAAFIEARQLIELEKEYGK